MNSQETYSLISEIGITCLKLEEIISEDSHYSYLYARHIIKDKFELGENIISSSNGHAYCYANNVIKGRFELGEKAIAESGEFSYLYAKNVLKCRFRLGEKIIKSLNYCYIIGYNHE